jgi:hypothetical protein
VPKYYHKFNAMTNGLADLGSPIKDRILVLNILRGLNQRFEHVGSIIRRYSPFPNFLKVRDDLLLEEIHMDIMGHSVALTALYTNATPPAAKPPSSMPSRPPGGGNGNNSSNDGGNWNKNNNKNRNSDNGGGKNNNGGGGRNSSSGQPTAPPTSNDRTGATWPTYGHTWQGNMTIYPGPVPIG